MTPDEIVRRAVKIIGEPGCKKDVERALEEIEVWRHLFARRTKKGKIAAGRLAKALRRVDVALKSDDLFPLLRASYLPDWKLAIWIDHCEALAEKSLGDDAGTGEIERCAASKAYDLMQKYGKPVSTTKRSPFERLAAALSGDVTADFHHHCRAAVRSAKTGSE
ncbi:MAG TPA: hypothetical protein VFB88_13995 [Xanthobacteraceae bacterium]|nr:hypothetical protein [Xanthobacteraceae bacterium]